MVQVCLALAGRRGPAVAGNELVVGIVEMHLPGAAPYPQTLADQPVRRGVVGLLKDDVTGPV